jgi:hypothetical protein
MGEIVEAFFDFLIRLNTVVTINMTRLLHTFLDEVRFFLRRSPAVRGRPKLFFPASSDNQASWCSSGRMIGIQWISRSSFGSQVMIVQVCNHYDGGDYD